MNMGKVLLGGLLGTLAITLIMYFVAPILIRGPMDIAAMLGGFLGVSWTTGMVIHFINGTIIFPLIFAWILWAWLPGGPAVKGMSWGVILWALAQTIVIPLVGGGFFSSTSGGVMAVIGSLIG